MLEFCVYQAWQLVSWGYPFLIIGSSWGSSRTAPSRRGLRCGTSEGGHKESPAADTPYGMASGGLQRLAKVGQGRKNFSAQMVPFDLSVDP